MRNLLPSLITLIIILSLVKITPPASSTENPVAAEIWRNNTFYRGFETIQEAIDESIPGDIIKILPGTHYEILEIIDKRDITITAKQGNVTLVGAETGLFNWSFHQHINSRDVYKLDYSEISTYKPNNVMIYIPEENKVSWSYGSWEDFTSFHAGDGHYYDRENNTLYITKPYINKTLFIS